MITIWFVCWVSPLRFAKYVPPLGKQPPDKCRSIFVCLLTYINWASFIKHTHRLYFFGQLQPLAVITVLVSRRLSIIQLPIKRVLCKVPTKKPSLIFWANFNKWLVVGIPTSKICRRPIEDSFFSVASHHCNHCTAATAPGHPSRLFMAWPGISRSGPILNFETNLIMILIYWYVCSMILSIHSVWQSVLHLSCLFSVFVHLQSSSAGKWGSGAGHPQQPIAG